MKRDILPALMTVSLDAAQPLWVLSKTDGVVVSSETLDRTMKRTLILKVLVVGEHINSKRMVPVQVNLNMSRLEYTGMYTNLLLISATASSRVSYGRIERTGPKISLQ